MRRLPAGQQSDTCSETQQELPSLSWQDHFAIDWKAMANRDLARKWQTEKIRPASYPKGEVHSSVRYSAKQVCSVVP